MKERTQISILISVALFFAILIIAYTALFSSPISFYDVTVSKETSSSLQEGEATSSNNSEYIEAVVSALEYKININTASGVELMKLDGIGEVIAERIIEYREEKGLFSSIDELKNIEGIGDKIFEAISDNITIE